MARTRNLIVGNWKMYVDSPSKAKELAGKVARAASRLKRAEVVICPPHPFLGALAPAVLRSSVRLGAQDVSLETDAKRTGEISVAMLRSLRVTHAIVGHSERRALGETDGMVAAKATLLIKAGLSPIVCIGEHERDMHGRYLSFLESEIRGSLAGIGKAKAAHLVIAYEPIWAIGKDASAAVTPVILHETSLFIKKILVSMYGRSAGTSIRILYGGSVEARNAGSLVAEGAVDGVLVGHASVDAKEFAELIRSVDAR